MHLKSLIRFSTIGLAALAILCGDFAAEFVQTADAQNVVPRPERRGRKYRVRIDSSPQRAAIYLDDKKYGIVGYTPWSGRLQKGDWTVIIEQPGFETAKRVIRIKRSSRTQETFIPLTKKPDPGVVEVRADGDKNAFGAKVFVDGQAQGTIPVTIKLKDGRHLVEVRKDGFGNFQQWIDVKEGTRTTINPTLKSSAFGNILVNSDVPDAEIYLDGNKLGDKTPAMLSKISAGPHVVEVRKAPALPWRQTVQVVKDKTVKVTAELKATIGGPAGNIQVLSNVDGARVFLDGKDVGAAPMTIKNVKVGDHIVEVKASGYRTREEKVKVAAGKGMVLKLDLQSAAAVGKLIVRSRVPEVEVFIDGKKIGPAPIDQTVSAGDHFVVVQKAGYAKFEQKILVKEGKTATVNAELKAVGGLRFLSNPTGAEVLLDGEVIGKTPMVNEQIAAGEHVVTLRLAGTHYDYEEPVKVDGGKLKVVRGVLEKINTGPTVAELSRRQRSLTSYGARTIPRGSSTIDVGGGYPYYFSGRITVGAGDLAGRYGFDAGVLLRSFVSRTELGIAGRINLVNEDPFSFGFFSQIGGGSNFVDDSARNSFFFNAGASASLTGLGAVTVTGRAYIDLWSDRHCPQPGEPGTDPIEICEKLNNGTATPDEVMRVQTLLGGSDHTDRETGARFMLSAIVEVAIRQRWNIWGIFEGAPFQDERAAFTDLFNGLQLEEDIGTYFRGGITYKF